MRKKAFVACLLLAVVVAGRGQTAEKTWSKYSNAAGKFSVLLPGQPEESSSMRNGVSVHTFKIYQGTQTYILVYCDYSEMVLKLANSTRLEAERDSFLKTVNGELISEREFKFSRGSAELPALEFYSDSASRAFRVRVILDGPRVYLVGAAAPKTSNLASEMERFFNSFTLN